jgi:hypothetical protein
MDAWRRVVPLHSTQPPYNIFEREIETDVLPYALQHKLIAAARAGARELRFHAYLTPFQGELAAMGGSPGLKPKFRS